jgi:hypothetical protein
MHVGVEYAAWLVFALFVVGIWRPLALTQRLTRREHVWCVANAMLCIVVITMLKRISATSCPWDLAEFGGALGHYVPHWLFGQHDGGPGGCFPSAHASCAFAFLAGPYLLRRHAAAAARRVALLIATTGFLLGLVQVIRGAHYASHALWTGWICWCVTALSFHASRPWLNGTNTPACRPTPLPPSGWSDTLPFAFAPSEPSEGPPTTHARTRNDCIARSALRLDRRQAHNVMRLG